MQCALLSHRVAPLAFQRKGGPACSPGPLPLQRYVHPASPRGFMLSTPGSESLSPGLARRRDALESLSYTASLRGAKASPAQSLRAPKGDSQPGEESGALPQRPGPFTSSCRALSVGLLRSIPIGLLFHVTGLLQKPLPLQLTHCQSECHLLEDAAHSHLLKVKFLEHPDARLISLPDFGLKLGQT